MSGFLQKISSDTKNNRYLHVSRAVLKKKLDLIQNSDIERAFQISCECPQGKVKTVRIHTDYFEFRSIIGFVRTIQLNVTISNPL